MPGVSTLAVTDIATPMVASITETVTSALPIVVPLLGLFFAIKFVPKLLKKFSA